MNKNLQKELKFWVPIILISPFILIVIISAIIKIFSWLSPQLLPKFSILALDFSAGISLADYLTLYTAFAGIGVTLFLGVSIFKLNEEKDQEAESTKIEESKLIIDNYIRIILDSLNDAIVSTIRNGQSLGKSSYIISAFKKQWENHLYLLHGSLGNSFGYLYDLFDYLATNNTLSNAIDEICIPIVKYISLRELEQISSTEDIISLNMYSSLCLLRNKSLIEKRIYKYKNGSIFYEELPTTNGLKYTVYNIDNIKIIDAIFNKGDYTGFMTLYNESGSIIIQGEFQNSNLVSGKIFNAICDMNGRYVGPIRKCGFEFSTKEAFIDNMSSSIKPTADFLFNTGSYERISDIKYLNFII